MLIVDDHAEFLTLARAVLELISSRDASDYGHRVERSGASGFIPKSRLSGAALAALVGR